MVDYPEFSTILTNVEGHIGRLTFNRPEALNAFSSQMIEDSRAALRLFAVDPDVRVVVITGSGRAFSSGADLASESTAPKGLSRGESVAYSMEHGFNPMAREFAQFPKPTVAAVNGVTAGGGVGVALSADIVVAARSAYFVQVFGPQLGLVPDVGCTWYMPRLVGRARARGLAMLGDRLPAEKAEEWGLIWQCVDDEQLNDRAHSLATKLADSPPEAMTEIKRILDESEKNGLVDQLDLERQVQGRLGDTNDFLEGVTAFLQKRKPEFTGS